MNELIREIEEDIRRERFEKLWRSFGKAMVGISMAIILVTIIIQVVQHQRKATAMELTASFLKGIDRLSVEDFKGAEDIFSGLTKDEGSPFYGLAMLRKAQAENALSDTDAAAKTYTALAKQDTAFGKLASLLAPASDTLSAPVPGEAFYFTRGEARGWQLLEQGKKDEAVALFLNLYNDAHIPPSLHGRLAEVLHHIAPDKMPAEMSDMREMPHE